MGFPQPHAKEFFVKQDQEVRRSTGACQSILRETSMKLREATIRTPDGKEFKDRVGADTAQEARRLLQERHGPRAVPYLPHMIPS